MGDRYVPLDHFWDVPEREILIMNRQRNQLIIMAGILLDGLGVGLLITNIDFRVTVSRDLLPSSCPAVAGVAVIAGDLITQGQRRIRIQQAKQMRW